MKLIAAAAAVIEETSATEQAAAEVTAEVSVTAPATADISIFVYLLTAVSLAGSIITFKSKK